MKNKENKAVSKAMRGKAEEALTELQERKQSSKVLKDYMKRVMNEENDLDWSVEGDAVEGPIVCVSREMLQALNEMKTGKVPGPS